jgi:predicted RNA-binding protein YlxR (DUF448 family)/ribosomal protein L7Ae-like RNA K-turn-binding protein
MIEMAAGNDSGANAAPKRNERTCAGCGKHALAEELLRVVHDPSSNEVAVDIASSEFGRGAHVHPSAECIAKALKAGFARVFKAPVVAKAETLAAEIVSGADRRIDGLLTGARRAGQLAVGSDVVVQALKDERAELVVVARDAAAATRLSEVERAIAAGKAIAFGDKQHLGSLMARDEVAVIAILHPGVAAAALQTYRMSAPFRDAGSGSVSSAASGVRSEEAWSSSEVR